MYMPLVSWYVDKHIIKEIRWVGNLFFFFFAHGSKINTLSGTVDKKKVFLAVEGFLSSISDDVAVL